MPTTRRARCRRRRSTAPIAMPTALSATNDHDPDAGSPTPPATTQRTRDSGVASRNSSRPDVSSDAQPRRASPRRGRRGSGRTRRTGAAGTRRPIAMSMSGNDRCRAASGSRATCSSWSMNELARAGDQRARRGRCRCPRRARSAGLADRPAGRAAQADERPRQARRRERRSSRRCRAGRTPRRRWRAGRPRRRRPGASDAQSNWPASGRWFVVQPNQVRFASGASAGIGRLVAVEDEPAEHHRAGDAGRRAAAEERRERERHRAGRERQERTARCVAGGRRRREISSPGQRLRRRSRRSTMREEHDDDRDRRAGEVAGQLLERDPAPADRRRGDELEAAAPRLGGERARQREDRPQADDEREERAVLVLEVAAQRARR